MLLYTDDQILPQQRTTAVACRSQSHPGLTQVPRLKLLYTQVNNGTARFTVVCHGCDGLESCDNCEIADDALVPTCSAALDHTSADQDGMSLEELDIDKGYWRATNRSKIILGCYNTDACKGGKTGTLGYCETGYAGMGPCEYNDNVMLSIERNARTALIAVKIENTHRLV